MSTLADRLREVVRPGRPEARPLHSPEGEVERIRDDSNRAGDDRGDGDRGDFHSADDDRRGRPSGRPGSDPAEILGGEWQQRRGQPFIVVERKYSPGYRHGHIAVADCLPPAEGVWPRLSLLAGAACAGRMLFVDVETTGLAGGAGSYAFLIGCGWFDGGVFRVRQFFLANFAGERGLLDAVAEAADAAGTVVTYNGKSFDLPLLETRFALHRSDTPFAGVPHVDMVHPARRLWRSAPGEMSGCRLSDLEDVLCGHRREDDVAGFEIPSRYFHYVRSANACAVEQVIEHNRLDILALAIITAHASQLLEDGPAAARTAREALGMGRLYERSGFDADARAAFERASAMPGGDVHTRGEALRAYAVLSRRQRRYEEAAAAWRRILDLPGAPPPLTREATEALAIHHEHRLRDPRSARSFALESMKFPLTLARREAVAHRLARLDRKLRQDQAYERTLFSSM